jgi:hypothetical protein
VSKGDRGTMIRPIAAALLAVVAATPAAGQGALLDPTRPPGALNPEVTGDDAPDKPGRVSKARHYR